MIDDLTITPMDVAAATLVTSWRYPPPYEIYSLDEDQAMLVAAFSHPAYGYFQLRQGGALVGFCCFGDEGRVLGGDYTTPALDVGISMRPDLTGRGMGRRYMGAVLAFAELRFCPPTLRLTVASFNLRARQLYARLGFRSVQQFVSLSSGREYQVMLRAGGAVELDGPAQGGYTSQANGDDGDG
ncbi:MAG: GNAT family N-acetyltransferase [Chloroflexales bacterium]